MNRIFLVTGVACLVAMGLIGPACSSDEGFFEDDMGPVYMRGECGVDDDDCRAVDNNIPGSVCVDHKCVCLQGMALCCPGGAFDENTRPLNCKVADDYRCRPESECEPPLSLPPPPPPPPPEPECEDALVDCPPPPDLRCGKATCEDGKCGLQLSPPDEPIAWQALGDCKTAFCDGSGNVIFKEELTDLPKTFSPCVVDACEGSQPVHTPLLDGEPCIDTNGVCATVPTTSGEVLKCVECIWPNQSTCTKDFYCPGPGINYCVPEHCLNQFNDPDETGPGCGGPHCAPCPIDETCFMGSDCVEGSCKNGICKAATHDDGVKNDGETGIDCGCSKCANLCKDGDTCLLPEHCKSGVCYAGICLAPTCFDMVLNGTEQGEDCGGECELACPVQSAPDGP